MEGGLAAGQMGNTITTPSKDVIVMWWPLLGRNGLGPLEMVYIDWKSLAWWERGSRTISRGITPWKALHQSPTIPRHYLIGPIKTWVGKRANNIIACLAITACKLQSVLGWAMYAKLPLGDKPHNRVIIPQDLRETVTNWEAIMKK